MRGATGGAAFDAQVPPISIHAPHARSDAPWIDALVSWTKISIHAPHARSDDILDTFGALEDTFQSTLLMRGATCRLLSGCLCSKFQSTLLMRGATNDIRHCFPRFCISIHAPHARSDNMLKSARLKEAFQSTLLMRGATAGGLTLERAAYFNPRSSCEERPARNPCDCKSSVFQSTLLMRGATGFSARHVLMSHFNPRSSCEERLCQF